MASTGIFKFSKSRLIGFLIIRYGKLWIGLSLFLVFLLAITGVFLSDLRYIILALMVMFIAAPMILALVLINHSLDPDVAFNSLIHSLEIDDDSLVLRIYPLKIDVEDQNEEKMKNGKKKDDEAVETENPNEAPTNETDRKNLADKIDTENVIVRKIYYESLHPYTVGSDYVAIPFNKSGILMIPREAFPTIEKFTEFVTSLSRKSY